MAVFKKIKDIYNSLSNVNNVATALTNPKGYAVNSLINYGLNKAKSNKPTTQYSSNTQPEGQKKTLPAITSNVAPSNYSGGQAPTYFPTQPKRTTNPYNNVGKMPYGATPKAPVAEPQKFTVPSYDTTTPSMFDRGAEMINKINTQNNDPRTLAYEQAGKTYLGAIPEYNKAFDEMKKTYETQRGQYQGEISNAQQRGQQQQDLINQQYAQDTTQAQTAGEADLRRAAEANRVTQAQLDNKFANLGTLGSTGYFGQSGETSRANTEFVRGQQESMDKTRQDVNTLNIKRQQDLMTAQSAVNVEVQNFQDRVAEINRSLAGNDVARKDAITQAYQGLNNVLSDIEKTYQANDKLNAENPTKDINSEIKIANDYDAALKGINYNDVINAYNRAKNADVNTSEGQFNIIYSFIKLLDPATGVKEGEFQNTANAQSLKNKAEGLLSNWTAGTTVGKETAQAYKDEMERIANPTLESARNINNTYKGYVNSYGLNPTLIRDIQPSNTNSNVNTGSSYQVGKYSVSEE